MHLHSCAPARRLQCCAQHNSPRGHKTHGPGAGLIIVQRTRPVTSGVVIGLDRVLLQLQHSCQRSASCYFQELPVFTHAGVGCHSPGAPAGLCYSRLQLATKREIFVQPCRALDAVHG